MWEEKQKSEKVVGKSKHHDALFLALMEECKHNAPGARLSAKVRTSLERLCPAERRELCSRTRDGCAPLFVVSCRGNVEVVEFLVHVCNADLEQRGLYELAEDHSSHCVTPLWAAAVVSGLAVLRVLVAAGADVNAGSDSGSTPVRSACFMTNIEVVKYLVEHGADIHRPNHNGGTCLINSVQSVRLCEYLLKHGAEVNARDMQHKTALHYATQEHRAETARLLLEHGASPHMKSRSGDDALRTACIRRATQIVSLLMQSVQYSASERADALELLGATHIDEFNDVSSALSCWRRATAIRESEEVYIEKKFNGLDEESTAGFVEMWRGAKRAVRGAREWSTAAQLEALATDVDALRVQALLVAARVLSPAHKDAAFRIMYRGFSYVDAHEYQRGIDLWTWALQIRILRYTLLYMDTCVTVTALTRLMLDAAGGKLERAERLPRHRDVLRVFALLAERLPQCREALAVRPVHKKQAQTFDHELRCLTHLIYLLIHTAKTNEDREKVEAAVRRVVRAGLRSAHTGDTPLHLAASCLNTVRSAFLADEAAGSPRVFPSAAVVALLLRCGADPCATNEAGSTALHVAAIPYNFSNKLVETLLQGGAHLDQPNKFGDSAVELLALNRETRVRPVRHLRLACHAARALLRAYPQFPRAPLPAPLAAALPRTLLAFLALHRAPQ